MDELIRQAYTLALFLHDDDDVATRITLAALAKLAVATAAQDKRLYYAPTGRAQSRKVRNKVSFAEPQLLQRLIYIESEPFEKQKEQQRESLRETELLIYFIKHLVKITLRRNSFYVTLGLSRVLHNYSTLETMELYNLVVQDPDRVGDESYYRACKGRVMHEIKERFGELVTVMRGQRGEERFQCHESATQFAELIQDCLHRFTPWMTKCVVPHRFDPLAQEISALAFAGGDPDGEHHIEVHRIHSVIHPDCFERLAMALKYDLPASRLEVPKFSLSADDDDSPAKRRKAGPLDDEQLDFIKGVLAEQSLRRRSAYAGLLRVVVDGCERARIDLSQTSDTQLHLESCAELIEVFGQHEGDEVLLATHLLDENAARSRSSITLEAGQRICFTVATTGSLTSEEGERLLNVQYRETRLTRAVRLFLRQKSSAAQAAWQAIFADHRAFKPALAVLVLAVLLAGAWVFWPSSPQAIQSPLVASGEETPEARDNAVASQSPQLGNPATSDQPGDERATKSQPQLATAPPKPKQVEKQASNGEVARNRDSVTPEANGIDENVIVSDLRGSRSSLAAISLRDVKKICLSFSGDSQLVNQLQESVAARLNISRRVMVISDRETADAMLRLIVKPEAQQTAVQAFLLDASGVVIWPAVRNPAGKTYIGSADQIAAQLTANLLDSLQRARHQQKNRR